MTFIVGNKYKYTVQISIHSNRIYSGIYNLVVAWGFVSSSSPKGVSHICVPFLWAWRYMALLYLLYYALLYGLNSFRISLYMCIYVQIFIIYLRSVMASDCTWHRCVQDCNIIIIIIIINIKNFGSLYIKVKMFCACMC